MLLGRSRLDGREATAQGRGVGAGGQGGGRRWGDRYKGLGHGQGELCVDVRAGAVSILTYPDAGVREECGVVWGVGARSSRFVLSPPHLLAQVLHEESGGICARRWGGTKQTPCSSHPGPGLDLLPQNSGGSRGWVHVCAARLKPITCAPTLSLTGPPTPPPPPPPLPPTTTTTTTPDLIPD
jgi:hypothetical protein